MAVRVRLKVRSKESGEEVETIALVNSGFETPTAQLLVPIGFARRLRLYPPPQDVRIVELGTAGGPSRMFLIPGAVEVTVLTGDKVVGPIAADILVSPVEEEVLINDKLSEDLKLSLIAIGSGKWRFIDDPPDTVRFTEKPQYW